MITENLSTLKIHKLTKEQYDRELANGTLEDNSLYLTPDDEGYSNAEIDEMISDVETSVKSAYDLANTAKTNAATAQTRADSAYSLAESKADSLSDLGVTATATELNYVDGVTSSIQIQLDGKAASSHNHSASNITSGTLSSDRLPTVPIEKGGTGATSAATARSNLGITPANIGAMPVTTIGDTDLNTLQTTGYYILYGSSFANAPQSGNAMLLVNFTVGTPYQIYMHDATFKLWYRNYTKASSTWSAWTDQLGNNISGNAITATKATSDASGNTITSTYATKTELNSAKSSLQTSIDGKAASSHSHSAATTATAGFMSTSDKTKLNGIATGAEVNQNAFSNVTVGSTTIAADGKTDTLTLVGSNITLTPDATNDKVTIGITKANVVGALGYTPPTTDTVYTHPTTAGNKHIPAGGSSGQVLKWSADGTAAWGTDNNTTYSAGTGISLSGTTFSNSGVRSVATGSSNGTLTVNTNGTTASVAVKGLADAAYKGVDTSVISGSSNLITSGAMHSALANKLDASGTAAKATSATSAVYASTATKAGTSTYATNSGTSSYSSNSAKASSATSATYSSTATYSKNAGTATKAATADSATNASTATYASSAAKASSATSATYASTATKAGTATYATNSGNANTLASWAIGHFYNEYVGNRWYHIKCSNTESTNVFYKVADIAMTSGYGDYTAAKIVGYLYDHNGNWGQSETYIIPFQAIINISSDIAELYSTSLSDSNHIRIVKTATRTYELQARCNQTHCEFDIYYQIMDGNGVTPYETYQEASTTGTVIGITQMKSYGNYAYSASNATNASTATYSTNSAKATSATSATYASTATKAGTATYATNSGTASYSSNGAKATSATSATYATTSTKAGTSTYATNSGTSTYSSNSAKATSATSATYSSTATYAKNAGTASYSSNGAKATSATSATYASTATKAGTATTISGLTSTVTELNYVDGVTSSIQTQLNNKLTASDFSVSNGVLTFKFL